LEILKRNRIHVNDVEQKLTTESARIDVNTEAITKKADESVLFDIDTLNNKVKIIETHLKREEEQGISVSLVWKLLLVKEWILRVNWDEIYYEYLLYLRLRSHRQYAKLVIISLKSSTKSNIKLQIK
jgi:hypothetical protein